jgi:hypothetical protein
VHKSKLKVLLYTCQMFAILSSVEGRSIKERGMCQRHSGCWFLKVMQSAFQVAVEHDFDGYSALECWNEPMSGLNSRLCV